MDRSSSTTYQKPVVHPTPLPMTKLSPAAQAVLDAYRDAGIEDEVTASAVLRAIALYCKRDKSILLSIAEELETQQSDQLN